VSDNITLPRAVGLHFREVLICGKGHSPHRCHDCDYYLDEAAFTALTAALAEPQPEPATDDQVAEADESHAPSWLDYRDGWRDAERFHGIRKEDGK
jgi:hypothetical protein